MTLSRRDISKSSLAIHALLLPTSVHLVQVALRFPHFREHVTAVFALARVLRAMRQFPVRMQRRLAAKGRLAVGALPADCVTRKHVHINGAWRQRHYTAVRTCKLPNAIPVNCATISGGLGGARSVCVAVNVNVTSFVAVVNWLASFSIHS